MEGFHKIKLFQPHLTTFRLTQKEIMNCRVSFVRVTAYNMCFCARLYLGPEKKENEWVSDDTCNLWCICRDWAVFVPVSPDVCCSGCEAMPCARESK